MGDELNIGAQGGNGIKLVPHVKLQTGFINSATGEAKFLDTGIKAGLEIKDRNTRYGIELGAGTIFSGRLFMGADVGNNLSVTGSIQMQQSVKKAPDLKDFNGMNSADHLILPLHLKEGEQETIMCPERNMSAIGTKVEFSKKFNKFDIGGGAELGIISSTKDVVTCTGKASKPYPSVSPTILDDGTDIFEIYPEEGELNWPDASRSTKTNTNGYMSLTGSVGYSPDENIRIGLDVSNQSASLVIDYKF